MGILELSGMMADVEKAQPPQAVDVSAKQLRKRVPRPPEKRSPLTWIVVAVAALLVLGLLAGLLHVFARGPSRTPLLDKEFKDTVRSTKTSTDVAIQPPHKWQIDDRVAPYALYVKGPREPGFSPVIEIVTMPAPGTLQAFVDEHKARLKHDEPSVNFISEEADTLDGCQARRLEYDCEYRETAEAPLVRIHALQYILKDAAYPMFYKITCFATQESFPRRLKEFEASAHTVHRLETKFIMPE